MVIELKPHQVEPLEKLGNGKILVGDVGSGKTITALAYYWVKVCGGVLNDFGSLKRIKHLFVITTANVRDKGDWQRTSSQMGIGDDQWINLHGISMVVDSWNNIGKYEDVEDAFFIFDEQRLVGAGAWTKSFIKIAKNNEWILLSATPGDTWLDYIPVMVANGFYKNRTEFKREHVVYNNFSKFPKVDRYTSVGRLVRQRNSILVEMPFERHTKRHPAVIEVDYDEELFERVWKKRWHVYEDRPLRDVAELFSVMRKVVNSDSSRLRAVRRLTEKHPRLIVFYNFDYELDALRNLKSVTSSGATDLEVAEWNGHNHDPIPESDRWVYLVQYTAGAEGWNCITTDAMCFYSLNYSYKIFHQAHGRIDRLNTPFIDLYYYMLFSRSLIDRVIKKSLGEKQSFNEASFMRKLA